MSVTPAKRVVNPKLGPYFAIFAAGYVALIILALIGEQLAAPATLLHWGILAGPLV